MRDGGGAHQAHESTQAVSTRPAAASTSAVRRQGVAQDRGDDLRARPDRPAHGPADLALSHPRAVVDRHLDDAQPRARGLDLHLDGPAVVAVAHVEPAQRLGRDGAEGTEVGGARARQQVHQADAQARAEHRVPRLGARGAPAEAARADHEVGRGPRGSARRSRVSWPGSSLRSPSRKTTRSAPAGRGDPGEARLAVAAARLGHDRGAGRARDLGRAVARAVVHDDHLVDGRRDRAHDVADRLLLVERGDHDHDARRGHGAPV